MSKELKKEKSHVVDYHRNSIHPVAARLSRWQHQPKLPENGQLDPHFDRHCGHPGYIEPVTYYLDPLRMDENGGQP
jgi:hypothetical protein